MSKKLSRQLSSGEECRIGKLRKLGGERIEETPRHRVDAIPHPTDSAASDPASIRFFPEQRNEREDRPERVEDDEQWIETDFDDGRIAIDPRIDSPSVHPDSVSIFEHGIRVK